MSQHDALLTRLRLAKVVRPKPNADTATVQVAPYTLVVTHRPQSSCLTLEQDGRKLGRWSGSRHQVEDKLALTRAELARYIQGLKPFTEPAPLSRSTALPTQPRGRELFVADKNKATANRKRVAHPSTSETIFWANQNEILRDYQSPRYWRYGA